MKIRLKEPYGFSEAGEILDPDEPVALLLIARGIAEHAPDEPRPRPLAADKAMNMPRRGRPR